MSGIINESREDNKIYNNQEENINQGDSLENKEILMDYNL